MEHSITILLKLIVLFSFVLVGYISYKRHWVSDRGSAEISKLIVNVFNPALIISTIAGATERPSGNMVLLGSLHVVLLFGIMILISPLLTRALRVPKDHRILYRIMFIFTNMGFMGIPLTASMYGQGATFFVALYILMYNLLFYSMGLQMFRKHMYAGSKFEFRQMINPGMMACVAALFFFLSRIQLPAIGVDFIGYLADACVPLSMLVTGFALAHTNLKEVFTDARLYAYTIISMLLIPICAALILTKVPFIHPEPTLAGIMVLMFGMPNGAMTVIVPEEYGMDSSVCAKAFALTTLVTIVTLPVVVLFV